MNWNKSGLFCENFGAAETHDLRKTVSQQLFGYNVTFGDADGAEFATVECPRLWSLASPDPLVRATSSVLRRLCLNAVSFSPERILVAAFGNPRVSADSLGQSTADRIIPSLDSPKVVVLRTGVPAAVGLDSAHTVSLFASDMNAQLIICIDALAAAEPSHLGSVIQITDAGCDPGGALSGSARSISLATLGIPTVAVGVPTVLVDNGLLLTCAEIDLLTEKASAVIAAAVNDLLYGGALYT